MSPPMQVGHLPANDVRKSLVVAKKSLGRIFAERFGAVARKGGVEHCVAGMVPPGNSDFLDQIIAHATQPFGHTQGFPIPAF